MSTTISNEGGLQITNTRKARDHLRVDMDAAGRTFIEIEICGGPDSPRQHVVFYLSKKALRALRDELTFYLDPKKAAG